MLFDLVGILLFLILFDPLCLFGVFRIFLSLLYHLLQNHVTIFALVVLLRLRWLRHPGHVDSPFLLPLQVVLVHSLVFLQFLHVDSLFGSYLVDQPKMFR